MSNKPGLAPECEHVILTKSIAGTKGDQELTPMAGFSWVIDFYIKSLYFPGKEMGHCLPPGDEDTATNDFELPG